MGIYFESLVIDFAAISIALVTTVYLYFKYAFSYWESKGVPHLKPSFPYGNMERLIRKKENFGIGGAKIYRQLKEKSTPYGGFYLFTKPILMLMDPELIKIVLIKEFNKFPDRGIYSNEVHDPLSANMFALKGSKWKTLRNKISPTFTSGKMKMMFQTLVATSQHLEQVLEEDANKNQYIQTKDLLARFTTDIIGSCVFGLDCNSLKDPAAEFRKYGTKFINSTLSNTVMTVLGFVVPGLMEKLNVTVTDKECGDFFVKVLKDNIEYREKNNVHRKDFMDLFIKLKNNESIQDESLMVESKVGVNANDGVTFNELSAQAFVFFIAGFEASSTTSTVALLELAQNIAIQDKAREEIRTVLKKYNNELTYEAIMEMKYIDQIISETLRKYPVAPNLVRICRENYKIPDSHLVVEKGTMVWTSILGIHKDPEYYPDPEKFDPERFTEEEKAKRKPFTYLPFGEGPRNCVGMRFALLQTKVALVAMLKNYQFILRPDTKVPIQWTAKGILLFPRDEILLQLTRVC